MSKKVWTEHKFDDEQTIWTYYDAEEDVHYMISHDTRYADRGYRCSFLRNGRTTFVRRKYRWLGNAKAGLEFSSLTSVTD